MRRATTFTTATLGLLLLGCGSSTTETTGTTEVEVTRPPGAGGVLTSERSIAPDVEAACGLFEEHAATPSGEPLPSGRTLESLPERVRGWIWRGGRTVDYETLRAQVIEAGAADESWQCEPLRAWLGGSDRSAVAAELTALCEVAGEITSAEGELGPMSHTRFWEGVERRNRSRAFSLLWSAVANIDPARRYGFVRQFAAEEAGRPDWECAALTTIWPPE